MLTISSIFPETLIIITIIIIFTTIITIIIIIVISTTIVTKQGIITPTLGYEHTKQNIHIKIPNLVYTLVVPL